MSFCVCSTDKGGNDFIGRNQAKTHKGIAINIVPGTGGARVSKPKSKHDNQPQKHLKYQLNKNKKGENI